MTPKMTGQYFIERCYPITADNAFYSMPAIIPAPLAGDVTFYAAGIAPVSDHEIQPSRYARQCQQFQVLPNTSIRLHYDQKLKAFIDEARRECSLSRNDMAPLVHIVHIIHATIEGEEAFLNLREQYASCGSNSYQLVYGRFILPVKRTKDTEAEIITLSFWRPEYLHLPDREALPTTEGIQIDAEGCVDLKVLQGLENIFNIAEMFDRPSDFITPPPLDVPNLDDYRK